MEQIITGDGALVSNLDEKITSSGIADAGVDYHTVAIIGPQSSGKSTILNLLFGTKFATMNEQRGRQQTTQGIHAAKSVNDPILLFDVEGCDSRERGDSDALFERKSALFALALSEVLVINMWESDIGRYQASNIPMLKTVFEVNIQLFLAQNTTKSKILFVIRDSTAVNFEAIKFQLNRDITNIWDEINLPDSFKGKQMEDFFEFLYFPIHHMVIQRDQFDADVNTLRKWFNEPPLKDYLFAEKSTKVVPGEGLSQYIRNLWEVINENKELNIPSQRTMLARFKCDENAAEALSKFNKFVEENLQRDPDQPITIIQDFKPLCDKSVENALKYYHDNSWRYSEAVVKEREAQLKQEISDVLLPYFNSQCKLFCDNTLKRFNEFISSIDQELHVGGTWESDVQGKIDSLNMDLKKNIKDTTVEPFSWNYPDYEVMKVMFNATESMKGKLVKQLEQTIITEQMRSFDEQANDILAKVDNLMWDNLRNLIRKVSTETTQNTNQVLKTNVSGVHARNDIKRDFQTHTISLVRESANYIVLKMKNTFDRTFKYEKNGRPRVWTRRDNINQIYENSRDAGLKVLRHFTYCRLAESDDEVKPNDPLTQVLIPHERASEIEDKFERIIIHAYEEARANIKAQANREQIPGWAWLATFLCSSNYIMKLLANPIFFALAVIIGGIYSILRMLGLQDVAKKTLLDKFNSLLKNLTKDENEQEKEGEENEEPEEDQPLPNNNRKRMKLMEKSVSQEFSQKSIYKSSEYKGSGDSLMIPQTSPLGNNDSPEKPRDSLTRTQSLEFM
ncbi:hypothetical protein TVAG_100140 [Trichomonas vaginalis G3]|uniref:Protein SEY1 homolog 2 n=1 Tax=Trichomonas vaginalis (strain ATCC PRA-98 / G3) TaxID=412133 RepID=SEY12_TRIV3|nr:SEY1 family [Trichomonas vaginalis G3]A2EK80.1 RecName: Full=Protein SEY1 homolog 2 [Trichomonas vaginalis G3]EAY06973.1 hypothetical protein TVAG_100140 [Trichomonas vaginalis G3]KAI5499122.1 SEY1 family [Trichomonas vaginalis G3]|eukprot:XP_001319196.1 hypothetical protein [Trichomonas vaginalis G3]